MAFSCLIACLFGNLPWNTGLCCIVLGFSDFNRVVLLSNRGYLCSHGMRLQRGLMEEVYTVLGRSIVARLWMTSTG